MEKLMGAGHPDGVKRSIFVRGQFLIVILQLHEGGGPSEIGIILSVLIRVGKPEIAPRKIANVDVILLITTGLIKGINRRQRVTEGIDDMGIDRLQDERHVLDVIGHTVIISVIPGAIDRITTRGGVMNLEEIIRAVVGTLIRIGRPIHNLNPQRLQKLRVQLIMVKDKVKDRWCAALHR